VADLSRTQIAVYGALAVALLLLGTQAIRSAEGQPGRGGEPAPAEVIPLAGGGGGGGSGEDVIVHVAGAVRSPGVYRLPLGARVTDAVERAGGPAGEAVLDSINLAARLADGQQVVVPASGGSASTATAGAADGPISLGTATAEQLDTIEGIGPVTAADIIAFRDRHGGLSSVEQLDEVSGIGPATMKALRAGLQP
jgi:competence protein ComEA